MVRTLGVVIAHPDDDAYGVAAVVALHRTDPEFRFFLVHATDGEGGSIAEGSGATPETLGAIRREEDRCAWRTLGLSPYRHEWFGYPDGGLADVAYEELVDRVAAVLGAERARCGGDVRPGRYHLDTRTTSRSAERLPTPSFGSRATWRRFRRLVYGGIRQSCHRSVESSARRRGPECLGTRKPSTTSRRTRRADRHHIEHVRGAPLVRRAMPSIAPVE